MNQHKSNPNTSLRAMIDELYAKVANIVKGEVVTVGAAAPITSTGGHNPIIGITPATDFTSGSLSAADKTKLDSLTPGAGGFVSVKFYGAVGDGITNDAAAIQLGLNTLNNTGTSLWFPAGTYNVASPVTVPAGTSIWAAGVGLVAFSGANAATVANQTFVWGAAQGTPQYNPAWYAMSAVYWDPVAGSDQNSGAIGAPVQHWFEIIRRYGTTDPKFASGASVVFHKLTAQPPNIDPVFFQPQLASGSQAVLLDTLVVVHAAFVGGVVTPKVRATETLLQIAGMPAGTAKSQLVYNQTRDSYAFIDSMVGAVATMQQPVHAAALTTIQIPTTGDGNEDNTWATGDTLITYQCQSLNLKLWMPQGGDVTAGGQACLGWVQFSRYADISGTGSADYVMAAQNGICNVASCCQIDPQLSVSTQGGRSGGCFLLGCTIAGTANINTAHVLGGGFGNGINVNGSDGSYGGDVIVHGPTVFYGGWNELASFYTDGNITLDGGEVRYDVALWGPGTFTGMPNTALHNASPGSFATTLLLSGLLQFGVGGSTGTAYNPGTGLWLSGIPITPANLDTYGGLENPQSGARICFETATFPGFVPSGAFVDVKAFGAVGNGIADDSVAIQNAYNALATTGETLWFSAGTYLVGSIVTIPAGNMPALIGQGASFTGAGSVYLWDTNGASNGLAATEASSLTRMTLADPWWQLIAPASAPKVLAIDEVDAPYVDGALVNPYADAPAAAFLSAFVVPPPGAVGALTFTRQMKLSTTLADPAATMVLAIYDSAGAVKLASTVCVLAAGLATYSVTYATAAPGTQYQVRVLVNDVANGTSAQAQFEDFGGTCTFAAATAGSLFAGPYQRMQITPGAYQDNLQKWDTFTGGYKASCFASVTIDTDAQILDIEYISTLQPIDTFPTGMGMLVKVNGRAYQIIVPTTGLITHALVGLPPGKKTVEIITDQNAVIQPAPTILYGTYLRAIYAPASSNLALIPIETKHRTVIPWGDSIEAGSKATPSVARSWAPRLRLQYPGRVVMEAYGSAALVDTSTTAAGQRALALKMATVSPTELWLAMGLNDWINAYVTAAQFQTFYGQQLDAFHAAMPGTSIFAMTMFINGNELVPNSNGEYLRDFREAIVQAVSTRTAFVTLEYGPSFVSAVYLYPGDANHFTNMGHDWIARGVASALGVGEPLGTIVSGQSVVTPLTQVSMTPYDYWETDSGLTVVGGKVTDWIGKFAGYDMAQAAGANQPTVSLAALNGYTSIVFAGTQWLAQSAAHALASPMTYFLVGKATTIGAGGANDVVLDSNAVSFNEALLTDNTPSTYEYSTGSGALNTVPAASLSTTEWWIICVVLNGAASRIDIFTQANAAPTTHSTVGSSTNNAINGFTLGATNAGGRGMKFQAVSFYVFTGAATPADENTFVEGYVKPKYGL